MTDSPAQKMVAHVVRGGGDGRSRCRSRAGCRHRLLLPAWCPCLLLLAGSAAYSSAGAQEAGSARINSSEIVRSCPTPRLYWHLRRGTSVEMLIIQGPRALGYLVTAPFTPATPAPPVGGVPSSISPWVPLATLAAAVIAALVASLAAYLQRKSGREAAAAARESAAAAQRSAEASTRSAKASEENVAVNERTAVAVAERANSDALSKRYQEASAQLGHERPLVRLAGVYAMTRLADDWPEERQTCVAVLCAYLRLPWPAEGGTNCLAEQEVRVAVCRSIESHINGRFPDSPTAPDWRDLSFDFRGARLRDFALVECEFKGSLDFRDVVFTGNCSLRWVKYGVGVEWLGSSIEGRLQIVGWQASDLSLCEFSVEQGGVLEIWTEDAEGHLAVVDARVAGLLHLRLHPEYDKPPASIDLSGVHLLPSGRLVVEGDGWSLVNDDNPMYARIFVTDLILEEKAAAIFSDAIKTSGCLTIGLRNC